MKSSLQKFLRLSSRTDWPLRNIHISNYNGFSPFYVRFFFHLSPTIHLLNFTIWTTRRVSYKKQELLSLDNYIGSPLLFSVGPVLLISLVFCVLLCVFRVLFCLRPVSGVPNITSVSRFSILDCPFEFL